MDKDAQFAFGIAAIIFAFFAGIALMIWASPAKADETLPDIKVMMGRVEAILTNNGYQAHGYAKTAAPRLTIVDELPNGDWGSFIPGDVRLSRAQPSACLMVSLAHELSHDATVKFLLIEAGAKLSPREVQDRFEDIARLVENHVASDGVWLPNCVMRRAVK